MTNVQVVTACAAEKRDDLVSFQLIELHSIRASPSQTVGYRIGEDQSGDNGTILQPVFSPMSESGHRVTSRSHAVDHLVGAGRALNVEVASRYRVSTGAVE